MNKSSRIKSSIKSSGRISPAKKKNIKKADKKKAESKPSPKKHLKAVSLKRKITTVPEKIVAAKKKNIPSKAKSVASKKKIIPVKKITLATKKKTISATGKTTIKTPVAKPVAQPIKTAIKNTGSSIFKKRPVISRKPPVKSSKPAQVTSAGASIQKKSGVVYLRKKRNDTFPKYFFNTEIPETYGSTYIRAMLRDPGCIFAYWEIGAHSTENLKILIGKTVFAASKRILRVSDITDVEIFGENTLSYFDVEIAENTGNWYITINNLERTYVIEYGILTVDGKYFSLARSNPVVPPRGKISDRIDDKWSSVKTDTLMTVSAGTGRIPGASEQLHIPAAESTNQLNQAQQFLPAGSSWQNAPSSNSTP